MTYRHTIAYLQAQTESVGPACATFFYGKTSILPDGLFLNGIFEDVFPEYIGVLLKNGAFVWFFACLGVFFGVERAHTCAYVRKMRKK